MSFARYEKYKNSGVEWMGEVPERWNIKKFRYLFRESPEKIECEVVGPMLSVSGYRGIEIKEYDDENRRRLDEDLVGYRIVRSGQLVVNSMWLNFAGLGVSDYEGHVSPAYRSYWINEGQDRRFVHHLMRSGIYVQAYTRLLQGIRPNSLQLSRDDLMAFPVLLPPQAEQKAIASFLDCETAKIDTLIAEQQRLIELLKEKRQAVISNAVTKGLNPNAPMKPSGIEWLGDVPEHWDVVPLKHLIAAPIIDGPHVTPKKYDQGIRFVSAESVSQGFIDFGKMWGYISPEDHAEYSKRYVPQRGDLLMVKLGATAGTVAIVETDEEFNIWVPLAAIRLNAEIEPRFILHVLRSDNLLRAYELNWTYGTQQTLGLRTISNLRIPLPPKTERQEIAAYLDSILPSFESLMAQAQVAIDLLQERRTTLISAAVTGQIDVRHLASKLTHSDSAAANGGTA